MRTNLFLGIVFALTILSTAAFGQAPQKFKYQAVARDANGNPLGSGTIGVQVNIIDSVQGGMTVFAEQHQNIPVNQFGLFTLEIGSQTPLINPFTDINWATGNKYIKLYFDFNGGTNYTLFGNAVPLLSVPYALYAETAGGSSGDFDKDSTNELQILSISNDTIFLSNGGFVKLPAGFSGDYSDLINTPLNVSEFINDAGYITSPDDADADSTNELQTLTLTGSDLSISNGNAVILTDNDNQTLSISGDTLSITGGNSITLPASGQNSWSLTGNSGTTAGANYIGTNDAQAFDIRTNDTLRVRITTKGQIETYNTGNSVFIGDGAGENEDLNSRRNIFIGDSAGYSNTAGLYNVAVGYGALRSNTTERYNIAIGFQALYKQSFNNTGPNYSQNIAIGFGALKNNQPTSWANGNNNIAIGRNALIFNTTGSGNVVVGSLSHQFNTTGANNTIIGYASVNNGGMSGTQTAWGNTVVGARSGNQYVLGDNNTIVGNGIDLDVDNRTNTVSIGGNQCLPLAGSNRVRIGNSSMSDIGGQVSWTTISDERIKENVSDGVQGLAFIMKLKPVTYNFSIEKSNRIQNKKDTTEWTGKYDIEKIRFSGFLAQDVEKTARQTGYYFSGVSKPENENGLWGLRYAEFTVPLVKAVQEQQEMILALKKQNQEQQKKIDEMERKIEELQKMVKGK